MKSFTFTVDDNIRFFADLTKESYASLFEHPYLAMYRGLHEKYDLKVQLNLFYENDEFDLSMMTDRYRDEWRSVSDWLKLSFHSRLENVRPYENSGYDEVYSDCAAVHREILRFAGPDSLATTTTLHYCKATPDGIRAMSELGVRGLLGLFGTEESPRTSYSLSEAESRIARAGDVVTRDNMSFAAIDMIINLVDKKDIIPRLTELASHARIRLMIHEQYFYPDYERYQSDFEEKLSVAFEYLISKGYTPTFFEV